MADGRFRHIQPGRPHQDVVSMRKVESIKIGRQWQIR